MIKNKHLQKKAWGTFSNALRDGLITKPSQCSKCPSTIAIEGHHDDYSKPLEVQWLCKPCHTKLHIELGSFDHLTSTHNANRRATDDTELLIKKYREQGLSYKKIGELIGFSESQVYKIYNKTPYN